MALHQHFSDTTCGRLVEARPLGPPVARAVGGQRIVALEHQKLDIDKAVVALKQTVAQLEAKLTTLRPDLLPRAGDYEQVLRAGLNEHHAAAE